MKNSTKGGAVANDGAVFSYDGGSVTDNGTGDEDSAIGSVCVSGLVPGDYTVNETSPPSGYGGAPGSEADQTVTVVERDGLRRQPARCRGHCDLHEPAALGYSGEFPRRRLGRDECSDHLRQRDRNVGSHRYHRVGYVEDGHGRRGSHDSHLHDRDRSLRGKIDEQQRNGGRLSRPPLSYWISSIS